MQGTWWKKLEELDQDQRKFVSSSPGGKHVIYGPPGCGKTNMLLLRAKFTVRSNLHNILFVTYANCLADFIRSGIGAYFNSDQVLTYWSWARRHIQTYYPQGLPRYNELFAIEDEAEKRNGLVELLKIATAAAPTETLYDAIFIDEAQDLCQAEIQELSKLSSRVTIAGDKRQGVYKQDGMDSSGFDPVEIKYHYRIGRRICEVADKLMPPRDNESPLVDFCRYRNDLAAADAKLFHFPSKEAQYDALMERLTLQRRTYKNEPLGVFFPKKKDNTIAEFREYIAGHPLFADVAFHDLSNAEHTFASGKHIHVMSIHGAKGTEFRAAHIVRGEHLKFPLHHREIIYTAVTRARTSVSLYYTDYIYPAIRSAFAETTTPNPEDLFEE